MRIVLCSNFLNHHQLPFCLAMQELGVDFTFVATTPVNDERIALGYHDMNKAYPFVLRTYEGPDQMEKALDLCTECDAVILGSAPQKLIVRRLREGKLTFQYSERIYKKGRSFRPRHIAAMIYHYGRHCRKPYYMLCASAYTACDFRKTFSFFGKTYKWGYFPKAYEYNVNQLMGSKFCDGRASILWVGRLLELKHPEAALEVARRLKADGYDFTMDFIGIGPLEAALKRMTAENRLDDRVNFLGSMSPEQVRTHMENARLFLFNSDFEEGWGAVLNEAMNSGCAVVASHAIGAVPFLLRDGDNGCVYRSGDCGELYEKVRYLLDHPEACREMGRRAYETIDRTWNARVAAKRLVDAVSFYQRNRTLPECDAGPLSRARGLRNDWYPQSSARKNGQHT